MSEETQQATGGEVAEETKQEEVAAEPKQEEAQQEEPEKQPEKKSVKFQHDDDLTFDEAQAEIDAIRARARGARENLKPESTSKSSSYVSSASSYKSYEDDTPKSKNMLSHLNSASAMLNYKIQSARSLVRKQEDLLRNLARMRENMERSECEMIKTSDYFTPSRYSTRRYNTRADSAPVTRPQVRDKSPNPISLTSYEEDVKYSDKPCPKPYTSSVTSSYSVSARPPPVSTNDYQPDEDFEREMAAIRKRVADLTKKANEVYTPRMSSYDYLDDYTMPSLTSRYLRDYDDLYKTQPSYEVTKQPAEYEVPATYYYYVPEPSTYHVHVPSYQAAEETPASSSYSRYLMESLDETPSYYQSTPDLSELYYDPLVTDSVYYNAY